MPPTLPCRLRQSHNMETSNWKVKTLLPTDNPAEWDSFVDHSPQGCIFCKSWWLEAVAPDAWQVVVVRGSQGILAGMPFATARVHGGLEIRMPQLTQTLGPLFAQPTGDKYTVNLSTEMELLKRLIDSLPPFRQMKQNCHYRFMNWLPYYWASFSQTTRYTYILDNLTNIGQVWDGMESTTRGKIRKAEKSGIRIVETQDIDQFLILNRKTFERQGKGLPYPVELVHRLDRVCATHNARRIYLAQDEQGRTHSALYVVFDQTCMYNLMQGGDPDLRSSGANLLAMWHSIQFASTVTQRYDFEGSMLPNVEPVFRSFGSVQKPYFVLSKDNRGWLAKCIAIAQTT